MPKTHGQPKLRPPKGTHTKHQPRHRGKGSSGVNMKGLRSYRSQAGNHPKKY